MINAVRMVPFLSGLTGAHEEDAGSIEETFEVLEAIVIADSSLFCNKNRYSFSLMPCCLAISSNSRSLDGTSLICDRNWLYSAKELFRREAADLRILVRFSIMFSLTFSIWLSTTWTAGFAC